MLKDEKIKKLYDVRIHNASQLAGFAKKNVKGFGKITAEKTSIPKNIINNGTNIVW